MFIILRQCFKIIAWIRFGMSGDGVGAVGRGNQGRGGRDGEMHDMSA